MGKLPMYMDEIENNPMGNPDQGINLDVLQIKLAKESHRWDEMVNRLHVHLDKTKDARLHLKNRQKERQRAKEEEIKRK